MSNLIKSAYFKVEAGSRTIDSDERVEEYIPNIYNQEEEVKTFEFQALGTTIANGEGMEGADFEQGLSVISMDDVVNEEREKLVDQINEEKEKILAEAREEADSILAQAKDQANAIEEMARSEGYNRGVEEGRADSAREMDELRQNLEAEYKERLTALEEQENNLEPAFADLIISLVGKITGVICENKKDVILYLIGSAMKNMERTSSIVLRVSKADIARVSSKKATLRMLAKEVQEFDIVEDSSFSENQCIIETDNKIIDCSLDAQLSNLEEHVKLLVY